MDISEKRKPQDGRMSIMVDRQDYDCLLYTSQILILNLMPLKEETELQLLRSLSNTPLQVDVTFMAVQSHEAKNTSVSHLNKFYQTFPELKNNKYDGMIITGAPVEQMEFEEVDYWKELVEIMDWTNTHVTSTIYLCLSLIHIL